MWVIRIEGYDKVRAGRFVVNCKFKVYIVFMYVKVQKRDRVVIESLFSVSMVNSILECRELRKLKSSSSSDMLPVKTKKVSSTYLEKPRVFLKRGWDSMSDSILDINISASKGLRGEPIANPEV